MRRPCLTCGQLIESGSYCKRHRPSRFNAARGSGGRAETFRRRTLAQTGGACVRCSSRYRVQAHHVVPVGDDPGQTVGLPLCEDCHRVAERRGGATG